MHPWKTVDADVALPAKPQTKPWYRWVETEGALVLEHGQSAVVFEGGAAGRLLPVLLPLLDGTRTVPQIVDELGAAAEPAVVNALRVLSERDLLLDGEPVDAAQPGGLPATVKFLGALGRDSSLSGIRDALSSANVEVVGEGPAAGQIVAVLQESGITSARRSGWEQAADLRGNSQPSFVLVVPSRDELARVADWNRHAVETATQWLQVLPFDGRFVAIGPLYVPGETCCYECYRARRAAASGYRQEFHAIDETPLEAGSTPALDAVVAGVAAILALRWAVHRDHYLPGVFYAYEQAGTLLTQHRVYRVPRCRTCSGLYDMAPPLPWFKEAGNEQVPAGGPR